jgi:solute:Na+ symporter, SSS family
VVMTFWFLCTHGANQIALQRYFSVKDVRAARRSYLVSALASFGLGVILAGVGLSLLHFILQPGNDLPAKKQLEASVPDDASPADKEKIHKARTDAQDKIFPQFIAACLPVGMRGLVVAALFAAAMSTIDSGANSISTIVTVDFVRRHHPGPAGHSDAGELRIARFLTATMGVLIVGVTVFLHHISKGTDIITLTQKGFNCFLGPLGGLFVLGMFSKRATAATVIPAVLIGEAVGVSTSYSMEFFGHPFSTHLVVPASWLATIISCHVLNLLFQTRATETQAQWLWKPVVYNNSHVTSG